MDSLKCPSAWPVVQLNVEEAYLVTTSGTHLLMPGTLNRCQVLQRLNLKAGGAAEACIRVTESALLQWLELVQPEAGEKPAPNRTDSQLWSIDKLCSVLQVCAVTKTFESWSRK